MGKIFKEVFIGILLTIVILILLIVCLYEYSPGQKTYSELEAYKRDSATSEVLKEIASSSVGSNSRRKYYSIL